MSPTTRHSTSAFTPSQTKGTGRSSHLRKYAQPGTFSPHHACAGAAGGCSTAESAASEAVRRQAARVRRMSAIDPRDEPSQLQRARDPARQRWVPVERRTICNSRSMNSRRPCASCGSRGSSRHHALSAPSLRRDDSLPPPPRRRARRRRRAGRGLHRAPRHARRPGGEAAARPGVDQQLRQEARGGAGKLAAAPPRTAPSPNLLPRPFHVSQDFGPELAAKAHTLRAAFAGGGGRPATTGVFSAAAEAMAGRPSPLLGKVGRPLSGGSRRTLLRQSSLGALHAARAAANDAAQREEVAHTDAFLAEFKLRRKMEPVRAIPRTRRNSAQLGAILRRLRSTLVRRVRGFRRTGG